MPRQVLAWQCKFCGAIKKTEKIAERHEKACMSNPESQNCLNCANRENDGCKVRKIKCSRAVSANCEHFGRIVMGGV